MISAIVVADSIDGLRRSRITTFEVTLPKWLIAQVNTYGMIRRNYESSRARPTKAILEQVRTAPYRPTRWNYRASAGGMQPGGPMSFEDSQEMNYLEDTLRGKVIHFVREMENLGAAKEDINRFLEPWMYAKGVLTSTTWENYFEQRIHGDAQGAHRQLAEAMRDALEASTPIQRSPYWLPEFAGEWHLPYVTFSEREIIAEKYGVHVLPLISAYRCARVSYGRPGVSKRTPEEEISRALNLIESKHWSPLEGPAEIVKPFAWHGAYYGWRPLRKCYAGESGSSLFGCQQDILPWAVRTYVGK